MKMTYQPKKRQRKKVHGFRKRMASTGGRKVLAMRRLRGRKKLSAQVKSGLLFYLMKGWLLMVNKDCKICRGKEYSYIYKYGRRIQGHYIIVFIKESQLTHYRVGIVTSKKIGNAVIRNRAKRQIREIVRKHFDHIQGCIDVVIVARFNIKDTSFELIEKDFVKLMKKAGIL